MIKLNVLTSLEKYIQSIELYAKVIYTSPTISIFTISLSPCEESSSVAVTL